MTEERQLPPRARDYLKFLASQAELEIGMISTGPERDQTITVAGSSLAQLLGPLRASTQSAKN
jgi:adenylosuccinate synthase